MYSSTFGWNPQPIYVIRRTVAFLLIGTPMAYLALKALGVVIRFFLLAGVR